MALAKLFYLGREKELLDIEMEYGRIHSPHNGKPRSEPLGGYIDCEFAYEYEDAIFYEYIQVPKEVKGTQDDRFYYLHHGEIRFYHTSFDETPFKIYKFKDANIIGIVTRFKAKGDIPMIMRLILNPAIQNYGAPYHKWWHESPLPMTEQQANTKPTKTATPELINPRWVNENSEIVTQATTSDKLTLKVGTRNIESGEITAVLRKKDSSELEEGMPEITLTQNATTGTNQFTTLEIKKKWINYNTPDTDQLIARIYHKEYSVGDVVLDIVPQPEILIEFRPKFQYDGEYGFDYMRTERQEYGEDKYQNLLGKIVNKKFVPDTNQSEYKRLIEENYCPITYPWYVDDNNQRIDYLQSWLTIYPQQTVELSLQHTVLHNPNTVSLDLEYDTTIFEITPNKIRTRNEKTYLVDNQISIRCLKEFSEDQLIKVHYQGRQMGQLQVLKNNKASRRIAKVVFVKVKTDINNDNKTTEGSFTSKQGDSEKEMLQRFLKQAYIDAEVTVLDKEVEAFNLTKTDASGTPLYPNFNKEYTIKAVVKNTEKQILSFLHNSDPQAANLASYMEGKFNQQHPKYQNHFKIFFFGDTGGRKTYNTGKTVKGIRFLKGVAKGFNTKSVVIFSEKKRGTVTHELLHAIGLYHSFSKHAAFTFKRRNTFNLMDYSEGRNHLWYWQWQALWEKTNLETYKELGE